MNVLPFHPDPRLLAMFEVSSSGLLRSRSAALFVGQSTSSGKPRRSDGRARKNFSHLARDRPVDPAAGCGSQQPDTRCYNGPSVGVDHVPSVLPTGTFRRERSGEAGGECRAGLPKAHGLYDLRHTTRRSPCLERTLEPLRQPALVNRLAPAVLEAGVGHGRPSSASFSAAQRGASIAGSRFARINPPYARWTSSSPPTQAVARTRSTVAYRIGCRSTLSCRKVSEPLRVQNRYVETGCPHRPGFSSRGQRGAGALRSSARRGRMASRARDTP